MTLSAQAQNWRSPFEQLLKRALQNSTALIEANANTPQVVRPHFESLLSQLGWGARYAPELAARLMLTLHPWPLRWGQIDLWRNQLEVALSRLEAGHPLTLELNACMVEILQVSGNPRRALEIAENVYQATRANPPLCVAVIIRCGGAWIATLNSLGELQKAGQIGAILDEFLDATRSQIPPERFALAKGVTLLQRAIVARKIGHLSQALTLITDAIQLVEGSGALDTVLLSDLIENRAVFHNAAGNFTAAFADLDYLEKNYIRADDLLTISSLHGNRGWFYWTMSRYQLAEKEMLQAIALSEQVKAHHILVRQVGNMGLVCFMRGDLPAALKYIQRQIEMAQMMNDLSEKTLAIGNRAAVFVYVGEPQRALPDLLRSLQDYAAQNRFDMLVGSLIDVTICYYRLQDLEAAAHYADRAYKLALENDNSALLLIALRALALILPDSQKTATLQQALTLARQLHRRLDTAGCLLALAHLADSPEIQAQYWREASLILQETGCEKWLEGKRMDDLVIFPIFV